ncbi:MAG: hypothetical protein HY007_01680 [Candidatus Sungbacteria bacterium]|nr:hypothetical protein [Candidatus Sungbacteria bacterium]
MIFSYGSLTKEVLKFLGSAGYAVLDGFLPPQYPEAKLARLLLGMDGNRSRKAAKHALSSTLHRLKQQGLICSTTPNKDAKWKLTRKGRSFLAKLDADQQDSYDLAPEDGVIRIVTFDIPEKFRAKRAWLREQLSACGYHLLQRSVFVGKRPLPDTFIKRIDAMRIVNYIHIASLNQTGTIEKRMR